ncbi:MAG: hypothetical protein AAB344_05830 [Bacteroidota bacterium]
MGMTYRLKASELGENFLQSIKALYGNKLVEIYVAEVNGEDEDETEYLMSSPENKRRLLESIDDIKNNRNIIIPDQSQFQ